MTAAKAAQQSTLPRDQFGHLLPLNCPLECFKVLGAGVYVHHCHTHFGDTCPPHCPWATRVTTRRHVACLLTTPPSLPPRVLPTLRYCYMVWIRFMRYIFLFAFAVNLPSIFRNGAGRVRLLAPPSPSILPSHPIPSFLTCLLRVHSTRALFACPPCGVPSPRAHPETRRPMGTRALQRLGSNHQGWLTLNQLGNANDVDATYGPVVLLTSCVFLYALFRGRKLLKQAEHEVITRRGLLRRAARTQPSSPCMVARQPHSTAVGDTWPSFDDTWQVHAEGFDAVAEAGDEEDERHADGSPANTPDGTPAASRTGTSAATSARQPSTEHLQATTTTVMLRGLPTNFGLPGGAEIDDLRDYLSTWGTVKHIAIARAYRALILRMSARSSLVEALHHAHAQLYNARHPKESTSPPVYPGAPSAHISHLSQSSHLP